jgi:AraC family transcriptional regulator
MFESTKAPYACERSVEVSHHLFNSGSRKEDTELSRHQAVRESITMMRSQFQNLLTLQDIASSVQLSQFHFNRIFRSITGIPPSVYLAALRIEQAKKLLLRTNLSVTSICFDVGYNSLGTFTTRFTQFVGATPTRLRQISRDKELHLRFQDWDYLTSKLSVFEHSWEKGTIEGRITVSQPFDGLIFIGVFTNPVPQGAPISCTVLAKPGSYYLTSIPEGKYYLFATALPRSEDFVGMLEARSSLRCSRQHPVSFECGSVYKLIDMALSPMSWTDAPILLALPLLLLSRIEECSHHSLYSQNLHL